MGADNGIHQCSAHVQLGCMDGVLAGVGGRGHFAFCFGGGARRLDPTSTGWATLSLGVAGLGAPPRRMTARMHLQVGFVLFGGLAQHVGLSLRSGVVRQGRWHGRGLVAPSLGVGGRFANDGDTPSTGVLGELQVSCVKKQFADLIGNGLPMESERCEWLGQFSIKV